MPLPRYDPSVVEWRAVLARFGILFPPLILLLGAAVTAVHASQERALRDELAAGECRRVSMAREVIIASIERLVADVRALSTFIGRETPSGATRDTIERATMLGIETPILFLDGALQPVAQVGTDDDAFTTRAEPRLRIELPNEPTRDGRRYAEVSACALLPVVQSLARREGPMCLLDPWGNPLPGSEPQEFVVELLRGTSIASTVPAGEPEQTIAPFGVKTVLPLMLPDGVAFVATQSASGAPTNPARVGAVLPPDELSRRTSLVRDSVWRLFALLVSGMVIAVWFVARYAAQRDQSSRRAFQAERLAAIGEAMTGLAHESRNAIQRGQASIEMLAKRVQHVPDAPLHLRRLQQAQEDLHQLYERVRSYAAPVPLNRQPAALRDVLDAAWNDLESLRHERAVHLRVEQRSPDTMCNVDPFAIRRAFCNVLENALSVENDEGLDRERVEIDVVFADTRLSGRAALEVSIRDNGPGLSAEQMRRIFEPFYTTRSRGTGLGMAITRRVVELHGGTIRAAPDSVDGAHFVITLPRDMT